jgi:hypothetical protein
VPLTAGVSSHDRLLRVRVALASSTQWCGGVAPRPSDVGVEAWRDERVRVGRESGFLRQLARGAGRGGLVERVARGLRLSRR